MAQWDRSMNAENIGCDEFGNYSVVRRLDPAGGLGAEAYLAVRTTPPGHERLNVLTVHEADPATRDQAVRSLTVVRNLTHPATVQVLEHFDHEGKLVLVFEHHDGLRIEQIEERLRQDQERLTDLAVWQIAHQLMGALAEAHEASDPTGTPFGLAHGHLGPDVVHIGWDGRVRVLGMGLAELFLDDERSEAALACRAPEHGSGAAAAPAADLYAAAAIIWSLLTGRRPPTPGRRAQSLAKTRADLPATLVEALDLALAPAERTITAREIVRRLEDDLERVVDSDELRWNIEIFGALSLFSPTTPLPPSTRPIDFQPRARPRLISAYPAPEVVSQPPVTVEVPTRRRPAAQQEARDPPPTSPWTDLSGGLDELTMEPSTRRKPTTGAPPETDGDPRTKLMDRPDFGEDARPGGTLVSSTAPDLEAAVRREVAALGQGNDGPPADAQPPAGGASAPGATVVSQPFPLRHAESSPAPTPGPPPFVAGSPDAPAEPPVSAVTPSQLPRRSLAPLFALGCVALLGGAAIGWTVLAGVDAEPETGEPGVTAAADPRASDSATRSDTEPGPGGSATTASPSGAPTAAADAPASARASDHPEATSSAELPPATDSGDHGSKLLSYEGYLVVQSSAKADVYVQGVRLGATNTKLKARCRQRFVRLKDPSSGAWLTQGQAVRIDCMKVTTVHIDP